jgi:putative membrane protein
MAGALYPWIKAFHVISIIAWIAGLLYLPRLFVYHAEAGPQSPMAATFQVMERRLLRAIMNPAMIATWVFGLWLLFLEPGWLSNGWLHVKLLCVIALTVAHHLFGRWRKDLAEGRDRHSPKFYRLVNEVPTVLMIVIVVMVIVKPF